MAGQITPTTYTVVEENSAVVFLHVVVVWDKA